MMLQELHRLAVWLYFNVWGNLVASLIWGTGAFYFAHKRFLKPLVKSHQEMKALIEKATERDAERKD